MTARAKINAIREAEPQYSDELIQPLRLVAKNFDCTIRRIPHAQTGEISPYTAYDRVWAIQLRNGNAVIENALGQRVFEVQTGEITHPEDHAAFWRKLGA